MFKHTRNLSKNGVHTAETFVFNVQKKYWAFYKPYGVLSQYTDEGKNPGFGQILEKIPKDIYPIGRLDADSEGLLLLSNDGSLNASILQPHRKVSKTYWAQVEGVPSEEDLKKLEKGVQIQINGKTHTTLPCKATLLASAPAIMERNPPIRFRANIPTQWIEIQIFEGKNRQVRKMTAAIGFPTLRLFRIGIGKFKLPIAQLRPGEIYALNESEVKNILTPSAT